MSFISLRAAVAASLMLASGAASAELHKFEYTGTVNYSSDPSVAVGTQFKGQFAYDDTLPNGDPMPGYGMYQTDSLISANVDGHAVDADHFTVRVRDNADDAFDIVEFYGEPVMIDSTVFPEGGLIIHLQTDAYVTNVVNGVGLPLSYDMSKWSQVRSYAQIFTQHNDSHVFVQFSIDAIVELPPPPCLKQNGKDAKKICWSH